MVYKDLHEPLNQPEILTLFLKKHSLDNSTTRNTSIN